MDHSKRLIVFVIVTLSIVGYLVLSKSLQRPNAEPTPPVPAAAPANP
jgi:hypothetical protein